MSKWKLCQNPARKRCYVHQVFLKPKSAWNTFFSLRNVFQSTKKTLDIILRNWAANVFNVNVNKTERLYFQVVYDFEASNGPNPIEETADREQEANADRMMTIMNWEMWRHGKLEIIWNILNFHDNWWRMKRKPSQTWLISEMVIFLNFP